MNTADARTLPGPVVRLLAIFCVAGFWLLPFSPLAAIGAVSMTRGRSDWTRKFAVVGAVLCIAQTAIMSLLFVLACLQTALVKRPNLLRAALRQVSNDLPGKRIRQWKTEG